MNRASEIEAAARRLDDSLNRSFPTESEDHGPVLVCRDLLEVIADARALRAALALPAESETCVWTRDCYASTVWNTVWKTECDHSWVDYWLWSRLMIFCPFCGKRIKDGAA